MTNCTAPSNRRADLTSNRQSPISTAGIVVAALTLIALLGGGIGLVLQGGADGSGAAVIAPPATAPPATPATAAVTATTSATTTSTTTKSTTTTSTTTDVVPATDAPATTPYVVPLINAQFGGWGDTHSNYPATDIFENGCGNAIVSPVNGSLLEVRRVNSYDPNVDNPATRGGRSISILGDDGVRYYLAHFELVDDTLADGQRVDAGQYLGTIGSTGRSSACHVHFGISPPCPDQEWSVRRGAVWPFTYLNDWQGGGQLSPVDEVASWVAANPGACAIAAADPFAPDA